MERTRKGWSQLLFELRLQEKTHPSRSSLNKKNKRGPLHYFIILASFSCGGVGWKSWDMWGEVPPKKGRHGGEVKKTQVQDDGVGK